jgi:hypothetical protein
MASSSSIEDLTSGGLAKVLTLSQTPHTFLIPDLSALGLLLKPSLTPHYPQLLFDIKHPPNSTRRSTSPKSNPATSVSIPQWSPHTTIPTIPGSGFKWSGALRRNCSPPRYHASFLPRFETLLTLSKLPPNPHTILLYTCDLVSTWQRPPRPTIHTIPHSGF